MRESENMDATGRHMPVLGSTPIRHADCCLSLSTTLLDAIVAATAGTGQDDDPGTLLSIGSGSGLLEYLLLLHAEGVSSRRCLLVEGVEVQQGEYQPTVNTYLPEQHYSTVQRTATVSSRLYDDDVRALMFVYPRQPSLVAQYMRSVQQGRTHINTVIYLGPRADWADFALCFDAHAPAAVDLVSGREAGLADYELMAVVRLHRAADP